MNSTTMTARLRISGVFECRDKDGNLLKTIEMHGAIPLESAQQIEQARTLINEGADDGDRSE